MAEAVNTITADSAKPYRPMRLPKVPPTELEVTAKDIENTKSEISMVRRRIGHIEADLNGERNNLGSLLHRHSTLLLKQQTLSQIPQP